MHQQVRMSRPKALHDSSRADEGSVVGILSLLVEWNLRSAGRTYLADGGEFVFSVRHEDDDHKDEPDQLACARLNDNDYKAKVYKVESRLLTDEEGALRDYIDEIEGTLGEPVIEVHILTPEDDGQVPVQLVTRSMLKRKP